MSMLEEVEGMPPRRSVFYSD